MSKRLSLSLGLVCTLSLIGAGLLAHAQQQVVPPPRDGQRLVRTILSIDTAIQESFPPNLVVSVTGEVPTAGFSGGQLVRAEYLEPPADGIQDYYFYATPPDGLAAQVISRIEASDTWRAYTDDAPWLRGVRVHGLNEGLGDGGVKEVVFQQQPAPQPAVREFEGSSRTGSLDEALGAALGQMGSAMAEGGVADAMATWELKTISGRMGGFAGFNDITVTIEAERSPAWGE